MKKSFFLIWFFLCAVFNLNAQDQNFCSASGSSCYQKNACYSTLKSQVYTFATVDHIFGKAKNVTIDLKMTVFSPCVLPNPINVPVSSATCAQNCKRPFILLMHGGGFRRGCRSVMETTCIEFAKRGYVAATIDYRLGWVTGDIGGICGDNRIEDSCKPNYKPVLYEAIYRAIQDEHAALRFIVHYANNLNIDTRYLYVGGQSAGGVMAANLAYLNQAEFTNAMPAAVTALGPVDRSGNNFTDLFTIAGVYNNWGGVLNTSYINGVQDAIPMIAFHGKDDHVVPFDIGPVLSCAAYPYNYGSKAIYDRLVSKYPNLPVEVYTTIAGHGIFEGEPVTDLKCLYRIQKTVCFFRRARQAATTKRFIDFRVAEDSLTIKNLLSISPIDCGANAIAGSSDFSSSVKTSHADQSPIRVYAASRSIIIDYTLTTAATVAVNIYDITGRLLVQSQKQENAGTQRYQSNQSLSSGVYIVCVSYSGQKVFTQKVAVH